MPEQIQVQCTRLEMCASWRHTISLYIQQFKSAYKFGYDSDETNTTTDSQLSNVEQKICTSMSQIERGTGVTTQRRLLAQIIAESPIFYFRLIVRTETGDAFWDPLFETAPAFLNRHSANNPHGYRWYTSTEKLKGHDLLVSAVHSQLALTEPET